MANELLPALLAGATLAAAAAATKTARRLHRNRQRPIQWACLECGHTEHHKSRTATEAWSWIHGRARRHATTHHPDGHMMVTHTLPPEWYRQQENPNQ